MAIGTTGFAKVRAVLFCFAAFWFVAPAMAAKSDSTIVFLQPERSSFQQGCYKAAWRNRRQPSGESRRAVADNAMTTCALLIAGLTAYSMLTHDGRRMVSHVEGTNIVYELVPTNRLPANLPPVLELRHSDGETP